MDAAGTRVSCVAAEDLTRLLVDQVRDHGFVVIDDDRRLIGCNAGATFIIGRDRDDLLAQTFDILYTAEDIRAGVPIHDLAAARKTGQIRREGWRARADGTRYWVDMVLCGLRDDHGAPHGFGCIFRDITGQHRSDMFLQSVLDNTIDAIVSIDGAARIVAFNRAAERMFGYSQEEVVGQSVAMLTTLGDRSPHHEYIASYLRTGIAQSIGGTREVVARRSDGSTFPMEISVTRFDLDGQPMFTGICRDLTVQHDLQAQLNQSQKMEALGLLAGGVAHDFNNLLMIVAGYCDGLRASFEATDSRLAALEQIALAADKAASLTAQLLTFSRHSVLHPRVLDLNRVLANTVQLLRRTIGEDITLAMQLDPQLMRVNMDQGHIEQILINLAVNARDAMPQGGQLTIRTSAVFLTAQAASARALQPGEYVRLDVSDSGIGMSPEVKARAFEPFFTTKPTGRGTGLGLATVYGIIRQSQGHVDIESHPGQGSTFSMYLPAVLGDLLTADDAANAIEVGPPAANGDETILVVEDEPQVREIVIAMLQALGYHVLAASQPDEAVALAANPATRIDAVVTDVVMPAISGRELADQLWKLRSDLKVLFMSGYTDDAMLRHGVAQAEVSFLQKPFTKPVLARKLRDVLDRR